MFENYIMQVAQDNILTAIAAIFGSLVIILPIAGKYISKLNHKLEPVGQYTDAFGQKGAEILDDLYMLADASKNTAPEFENYIRTKYGKDLTYFETRAKVAAQQAQRFKTELRKEDPAMLANSVVDLPREPFPTKGTKIEGI